MLTPESAWVLTVRPVLNYIAELSLLLPLWIGYRYRFLLQKEHKVVFWCCLMWAVLTIIGETLSVIKLPNLFIWNIVTVLEVLFLVYAFHIALCSERTRLLLRVAAGIFSAIAIIDFFYLSGLHTNTIFTVAVGNALLIATVLFYFEQLLHDLRVTALDQHPMFIIGVGVIVYFAGTVMIFLLHNSVIGNQLMMMMMINSILSIFLNSTIARAFWLVGREQTKTSKAF